MELKKDNRAWTVSRSLHSLAELRSSSGLEYAFLSPIFDSISKQGYKAAFEEEKLRQALADNSVPVIALGGVQPDNVAEAKALGFAGVAALGYIWQSRDPVNAFEELDAACQAA